MHPIKAFNEVPGIKELGVSQDHFSNWYHTWLSQKIYKGRGTTGKKAFNIVLYYYVGKNKGKQ